MADWAWAYRAFGSIEMRLLDSVRSSTQAVTSTAAHLQTRKAENEATLANVSVMPGIISRNKDALLDFRRRYANIIVAATAGIAIVPALLAGPTKMEKLRVGARNLLLGGGGAAVLFNPELIFRTAPAFAALPKAATAPK